MTPRLRSQSGAVLVFVAVSMLGLLAFVSLATDYGIMWVGRSESQNAADAGALAGARSLVTGESIARASEAGQKLAMAHRIFGQAVPAANVTVTVPLTCPPPHNIPNPVQACVKVDVRRPDLPVFFAPIFNVTTQGAKATATAMAGAGNATNCLKPWMIPDKYQEKSAPVNQVFNPGVDTYVAPAPGNESTLTGYTMANVGTILTLKEGDPHDALAPSMYYEIGDANTYEESISGCRIAAKLGDIIWTLPGDRKGPTKQGTKALIDLDPNASWNGTEVVNSDPQYARSPRIVPVAMFSPEEYVTGDKQSGTFPLHIVNMMGFFIISIDSKSTVTGVIMSDPSIFLAGGSTVATNASFLKTTILVR